MKFKYLVIVIMILSCSKAFSQEKKIYTGYYFVIKLNSINHDSIDFKTIEIYQATRPAGKLINSDGKEIPHEQQFLFQSLCNRTIFKGYFKGMKKKYCRKVIILHSSGDFDEKSNIVTFDKIIEPKNLNLNQLYLFTRQCN